MFEYILHWSLAATLGFGTASPFGAQSLNKKRYNGCRSTMDAVLLSVNPRDPETAQTNLNTTPRPAQNVLAGRIEECSFWQRYPFMSRGLLGPPSVPRARQAGAWSRSRSPAVDLVGPDQVPITLNNLYMSVGFFARAKNQYRAKKPNRPIWADLGRFARIFQSLVHLLFGHFGPKMLILALFLKGFGQIP